MRTAIDCPFSPHADVVPPIWAGRVDQLRDWDDIVRPRKISGLPERGRTMLGEAGLGKSSLLRKISEKAVEKGDWVTPQLRIPSKADPLKVVAAALLKLADTAGLPTRREKRLTDLLSRVSQISLKGYGLSLREADGPEPFTSLTELLVEIGTAAMKRGDVVVLIHIDEVQNIADEHVLSQLLIALGDAMAHEVQVTAPGGRVIDRVLPIAVYLTGLPDFADMSSARRGATFGRRFQTTTLESFGDDDLAAALQPLVLAGWEVPDGVGGTRPVTMAPEARDEILELCKGEPFLFQLAGQKAWYAGSTDVITREQVLKGWEDAARDEAATHVERIIERLPEREREMLEAMVGLPPEERSLKNIAQAMGFEKSTQAGTTAQRLDTIRKIIRRGKVYTFRNRAIEAFLSSEWPDIDPE
ncbi:ATP-binding protein [Brachybacterium sp. GU-2]|uniref:ATP-binding protein n=1 Tax=Brachybacterium sp. GU-2 TaxID=3069708 RepID=UPI00280BACCF|nr:ATP-binding protein [Brachybacterium sp. GU-2]WME23764.1 ATP-binding protein [Brachybacterium sp. GU-2]